MSSEKFSPQHHDSSLEKGVLNQVRSVSETDYRRVVLALLSPRADSGDWLDITLIPMIWMGFNADSNSVIFRLGQEAYIHTSGGIVQIAGTVGTGFFLGSGGALATAGPLGALIAYLLVGTTAYSSLCSLCEMTTWAPISGTFPHFAGRWVDPALGFAVGWNFFYGIAISIPTEISAATVLVTFWDSNTKHAAIYIAVIWVVILTTNVLGARWFGEGLVIDLGGGPDHDKIGFRYWRTPGALNRAHLVSNVDTDRFLAWINVLVQTSFAYLGIEIVAIAASETENPRHNIAKAARRVFWRICIFYVFGIVVVGMLVAYNDHSLLQRTGTVAQSPFVIAMNRAGVRVFPHIINACVFSSALSSVNTALFSASRILYGLALRGQAPKLFTRCTKWGLPLPAIFSCVCGCTPTVCWKFTEVYQSCFAFLALMTISAGSETVFHWFVGLSTTSAFFGWFSINLTFSRFRSGMLVQGIDPKSNVYYNRFQPWICYWGMFWTGLFILISGYAVFFEWSTARFLISYLNIPLFFGLYVLYKISKKSRFWRASEMDFYTGIPSVEETEVYMDEPHTFLQHVADALF
ncbi:hypothetical protein Ac2012v2_003025 [Leucoagaricus gongylophorus]